MKRIIATMLSIFFTTSVFAKNIEILTTSTLKGPPGVVINTISDLTRNTDLKFTGKQTSGCGEAVDLFNNTKEPIAIIWSDTMFKHTQTTKHSKQTSTYHKSNRQTKQTPQTCQGEGQ